MLDKDLEASYIRARDKEGLQGAERQCGRLYLLFEVS